MFIFNFVFSVQFSLSIEKCNSLLYLISDDAFIGRIEMLFISNIQKLHEFLFSIPLIHSSIVGVLLFV